MRRRADRRHSCLRRRDGACGVVRLTPESFRRPDDLDDRQDPRVLYARSYLLTRAVVGALGMLLPVALMAAEVALEGDVVARGSLSAYYHTAARDVLVGTLSVVGVLLMTYLASQPETRDFWLSLVAGIAVLVVAFVPTARPGVPAGAPACGTDPSPAGCVAVQQALGETAAATVHFLAAGVFVLSLAALCFVFARREQVHAHQPGPARFLRACGWTILAAVGWILLGRVVDLEVSGLTALYVGEVVAVWAFGAAWLAKGRDLWLRLLRPRDAH